MDFSIDKKALRKELRTARAALSQYERAAADARIVESVCALVEFEQAETVLSYLSFADEIDTRTAIRVAWAQGKTVALPHCVPGTRLMTWHVVTSFDDLITSKFGIDEPADDPTTQLDPATVDNAIALVPGLTFDAKGYRIGYGGGFYDIFLEQFNGTAVGLCRDAFLAPAPLAHEAHDLPVDIVVTDARTIHTRD